MFKYIWIDEIPWIFFRFEIHSYNGNNNIHAFPLLIHL